MRKLLLSLAALSFAVPATAHETHADATYMANEAVLVVQGDTKIMFDPFFASGFNNYQLVPAEMKAKVMAQQTPFDGIDGVFVSHVHGDHFDADETMAYMEINTEVNVFISEQGGAQLRALSDDKQILDRIVPFALTEGGDPISAIRGDLNVDAVRIPHSGWPSGRRDINNIVFRVTLDDGITVMHMGDADVNDDHYAPYEDHWRSTYTNHAFPPYWYFGAKEGEAILTKRLKVGASTGIHVPIKVPGGLARSDYDYFSKPGEVRMITLPEPKEKAETEQP
jgi:L-ascorbate metabolism protein UlaG (beta-lactamase superfamily)